MIVYSDSSVVHPNSAMAGRIAQRSADGVKQCSYDGGGNTCGGEVVGCAVHSAHVGKGDAQDSYFVPVCERHKGWEFAKLAMDRGDGIYL